MPTNPVDQLVHFNGVDFETGKYLIPAMRIGELAAMSRGKADELPILRRLKSLWNQIKGFHLGLPSGVRPERVEEAGWAVVFHENESEEVRNEVLRLLEHRRQHVPTDRIKVLVYKSGWSATDFLTNHQVAAGSIEPHKVPYYLLIVGSPELIPFIVAQELDVEYATGRLCFDTPAQYKLYIDSVIDYEDNGNASTANDLLLFGTNHDEATSLSFEHLIKPLDAYLVEKFGGIGIRRLYQQEATNAALSRIFGENCDTQAPKFLFTASHGMGTLHARPLQRQRQGALLCQDWKGEGAIDPSWYWGAKDISSHANFRGMISFHFACFGAGTPKVTRFPPMGDPKPTQIAEEPFVAQLPQKLLAHPNGGALACISHVDRAWSCSFQVSRLVDVVQPFANTTTHILNGVPVGHAVRDFRDRYGAASVRLLGAIERARAGGRVSSMDLATWFIERNDAEGYTVLGDPAVHLPFSKGT